MVIQILYFLKNEVYIYYSHIQNLISGLLNLVYQICYLLLLFLFFDGYLLLLGIDYILAQSPQNS